MGMPETQRINGDITRELAQTLRAGIKCSTAVSSTLRATLRISASSKRSMLRGAAHQH